MMSKVLMALSLFSSPEQMDAQTVDWTPLNGDFRKYYGWDDTLGTWEWVQTPEGLSFHVFTPIKPPDQGLKGTLFLVHGYLEHGGTQVELAKIALQNGWQAVALDLPGHGLSSGERATISDFSEYARAFGTMVNYRYWVGPWAAAGHSTGCATIMEAYHQGIHSIQKVWFASPLVRTWLWGPTQVFQPLIFTFTPQLPARNGATSRDPVFNEFLEKDPLRISFVPRGWVAALVRWEATTRSWEESHWPLEIIQGTADTVVDGAYNIEFLKSRFPGAKVHILEGAYHDPIHDEAATALVSRGIFTQWLNSPGVEIPKDLGNTN